MFKRFATSLTKAPQAVFFMKDSWGRIIGYILLIPFLLTLPLVLRSFVTDNMTNARYQKLITTIQEEFRSDEIEMIDGLLVANQSISASFDYITLVVGRDKLSNTSINILFEEEGLVMIVSNMEVSRVSYASLELSDHDFSSREIDDVRVLSYAVKQYIESQDILFMSDFIQVYVSGLFDYLFYILMLSLLTLTFFSKSSIPLNYRFKLSVYLTTIVIVLDMLGILFSVSLGFFTFLVGYFYHIWAYRFIKIIEPGGH